MRCCGPEVEVEGIVSIKTGGCPEDCHFCSQSGRFETPVRAVAARHPVAGRGRARDRGDRRDRVLHRRRRARPRRAPDGAGPRGREGDHATTVDINVACSLGILTREQGDELRRRSASTATTTTSRPRARTSATSSRRTRGRSAGRRCSSSASSGMEVCCGGIIGMGETLEQRAELAAQFAALDPDEVPLNFLDPRPGTPFADLEPVPAQRRAAHDRRVPARAAADDPALRRRARAHAGRPRRPPGHGRRHQRRDRRQLPDDARPRPAGGPRPARLALDAGQGAVQDAVITEADRTALAPYCAGCGKPAREGDTRAACARARPAALLHGLRPQARGPGAADAATRRECVRCP